MDRGRLRSTAATEGSGCSPFGLHVLPLLLLRLGRRPRNSGLPVAKFGKTPRNAQRATPSSQERCCTGWQRVSLGLPMPCAVFGLIKESRANKGPGVARGRDVGGCGSCPCTVLIPAGSSACRQCRGPLRRAFGLGQRPCGHPALLFRRNPGGGRASCGAGLTALSLSR